MAVRDIIQAAGGSAATTAATYVEDVFSTYLYSGTGASQTIANGIDLSTKGGMVWLKSRSSAVAHTIYDTVRGAQNYLIPSETGAADTISGVTAFNTTGFTVGTYGGGNGSGNLQASWTFRKQAKFFDVVTYTGNGVNEREIAHNLGCEPGFIIIKRTDTSANWKVRETQTIGSVLCLNTTDADGTTTYTGGYPALGSTPTTVFKVRDHLNPSDLSCVNASGGTYVAYLFAKSNSGGFGAAGTDSVVACGSFSGLGEINLGWEPQYLMFRRADAADDWFILDNMRGWSLTATPQVKANTSTAEGNFGSGVIYPTAKGFYNNTWSTGTFIYLAIRRGPMKTPTDATKVFANVYSPSSDASGTVKSAGFPVDMNIRSWNTDGGYHVVSDRLRGVSSTSTAGGVYIATNATDAESSSTATLNWSNTGFSIPSSAAGLNTIYHNFRRAPGFFDVVCYTGTGSATTVAHNLGVAPELMIVKSRSNAYNWRVYSNATGATSHLALNLTDTPTTSSATWNDTSPTTTVFSVGTSGVVNGSGSTYVAYLFATCPGVSKVFNFTGNGSSQTINCGFAAGARFVLIKRTDSTGDWWVYDSARGIVSAADPALALNSTSAEVTTADAIDPDSSGFIVNQEATCNINVNNATYIGLAIA